ncbi:MAG TPA: N-methyl-L-tryptophan oxidase [Thermomicrobiales bacterium]|nr:N-methyl-L-tryptophan oxidase [Thermomicrobiales bacterium]
MNATTYDAIVIGGGTMGSAAAWELGKRGLRALALEQFSIPHAFGSHGGQTRVIRHAYAESPDYVPLVRRADQLWQELEAAAGRQILVRCGGLELAAPGYRHAARARVAAVEHGIAHEWLAPAEVNRRWPGVAVPDDWEALFSADAGFLLTEPAIASMADQARRLGVDVREREPVVDWSADGAGVRVITANGTYRADRLIVAAGAWSSRLLADLAIPLEVRRKTLFWLAVADPAPYRPESLPVFISDSPLGEIYGFPLFDRAGLKIANHAGGLPTTPDAVDRAVHPGEERDVVALARLLFRGVGPAVVDSTVCLYTVTPDGDFVIDRHPAQPQIAIGAGFSGHGFKFATAVGEALVDLAVDPAAQPLPRLSLARFAATGARPEA